MAGDVQADESVVLPGGCVQARHVLVTIVVDRGEVTAGQQVLVVLEQRLDRAVGAVPEASDDPAGRRTDRGEVAHRTAADRLEVTAQPCGGTRAAERDGVDFAADARIPRRDLVRRTRAEAEGVVAGEGRPVPADFGETAHGVHGAAALHKLTDLLRAPAVRQRRSPLRRCRGDRAGLRQGWPGPPERAERQRARADRRSHPPANMPHCIPSGQIPPWRMAALNTYLSITGYRLPARAGD